jgi:L-threonylcarbamoyladenylate synthase
MSDPSKSPDRHTFQKEGYKQRQAEKGEPLNEAYLDFFDKILNEYEHKFDDPTTHKNNLEYDLVTTDWMLEKVRASESYAQNLYAAMHLMDQKNYSKLYIERFEELGIGISMNDRLNRATKKFEV